MVSARRTQRGSGEVTVGRGRGNVCRVASCFGAVTRNRMEVYGRCMKRARGGVEDERPTHAKNINHHWIETAVRITDTTLWVICLKIF